MRTVELVRVNCSPKGGGGGTDDVNVLFCVHILPPAQTTDSETCDMTLCDSVHSGDAIGSFVSIYVLM